VPISTALMASPRFHHSLRESDWAYRRLEANARSMCEGIRVWVREMTRPESERSPTVLAHEVARSERMADLFEARVSDPLMRAKSVPLSVSVARQCPLRSESDRNAALPRIDAMSFFSHQCGTVRL
jgi:hypothetical protein